ncbi:MAG: lipase family protein [Pseudonocardiaceae bacterium]
MSTSLECRLLCASMTAFSITNDGPITPPQPYFDAAQFRDDPAGFVSGSDAINACLVGTTVDGVVLAFRGTLPLDSPDWEQTIRDWINDLDAELVRGGGLPGLVHAGFWGSLDSLWAKVVPEVQRRLTQAGSASQLYVTGHSKGAAVANLAAMRFLIERGRDAKVFTFAGPHPGNEDFATGYDAHIASVRYEYADDIVPFLPPSLAFRHMFALVPFAKPYVHRLDLDYSAVGKLQYITRAGAIVDDSPMLRFQRYTSLAELMITGGFQQIAEDHRGACGGGYMGAVCPKGVCP